MTTSRWTETIWARIREQGKRNNETTPETGHERKLSINPRETRKQKYRKAQGQTDSAVDSRKKEK